MTKTEDGRIELQFDVSGILKFINHISEVNSVVTAIYHLAKTGRLDNINPLETDGLPIAFINTQVDPRVTAEMISDWVFKKAFEDFIVGLTQSLIESYTLVRWALLAENSKTMLNFDEIALQKEIDAISAKAHKLNFPTLMDELERMLGDKLSLKDEINSINKIRNCLVHKDAIVNDQPSLTLKYLQMRMFVQKNGELVALTKEVKRERFIAEKLEIQSVMISLSYLFGEKLIMTPDIFKDVTYTCIVFIQELIKKLPLPEQIKDQFCQPFTLNLIST